ncbi:hypothetical protein [Aliiroseovarius crassostreae]|uniref:Lipoprotein n=1 Tax=Aliiroseovarius crassostreae TaxID=154981 RepID=A0A9Q9HCX4_9RHOB|nr:hypothetical protein [Aliiroseovarius crassostreae]UWP94957.1 hypothetical protein K3X48_12225 [Aliiroseovarius crassostreae]UWP98117.1 hypothetical protein K3X53_12225 [Aliiroseovarius crassostreae]
MHFKTLSTFASVVALMAACSQAPAPDPIRADPVFNKLGEPIGCEQGYVLVAGTAAPPVCVPDGGECADPAYYDANGSLVDPCPEPRDPRDRGDTPQRDPQRPTPDPQ